MTIAVQRHLSVALSLRCRGCAVLTRAYFPLQATHTGLAGESCTRTAAHSTPSHAMHLLFVALKYLFALNLVLHALCGNRHVPLRLVPLCLPQGCDRLLSPSYAMCLKASGTCCKKERAACHSPRRHSGTSLSGTSRFGELSDVQGASTEGIRNPRPSDGIFLVTLPISVCITPLSSCQPAS